MLEVVLIFIDVPIATRIPRKTLREERPLGPGGFLVPGETRIGPEDIAVQPKMVVSQFTDFCVALMMRRVGERGAGRVSVVVRRAVICDFSSGSHVAFMLHGAAVTARVSMTA